jgi:hypothetical protein
MSHDVLPCDRTDIRRTDSNSLLRLYDLAARVYHKSKSLLERNRADRAIQRIAQELHRRGVAL